MDPLENFYYSAVLFLNAFCDKIYLVLYTFHKVNCHLTHASDHVYYSYYWLL